ncbi:MAG: sulfatase-like hydrolase/transferase [Acetobacteraceae bacterium]|nr:sulfatase-like hydrolase/transferase [Acetobacteraceae bacterium]
MDRRTFVKGAAAASAASFAFGPGVFDGGRARAQSAQTGGSGQGTRPNILVIKVDELRFPSVFPPGITNPGDFLKQVMPNLYQLWQHGVKFAGHYTAACACTPARGTIITGLYSQQSWLVNTVTAPPGAPISLQPWLNPAYPTYGKLLRQVGYRTPYIGKWHVSIPPKNTPRLEAYGFDGLTWPDPTGANLQGTVGDENNIYQPFPILDPSLQEPAPYLNDGDIANQGVQWLQQNGASGAAPWCLTVSFVNPHDKEFFWAGTEFQTYNQLFNAQSTYQPFGYYSYVSQNSSLNSPPLVPWELDPLRNPSSFGYPAVPPNWENAQTIAANKPSTQTFARLFSEAVWGGVTDDSTQQGFTIDPYPHDPNNNPICKSHGQQPNQVTGLVGVGKAPFSYWQRGLDSYTQIMSIVDGRIGDVLNAFGSLPMSVQQNTVIVFMSDHGEYAGAHGFVSGKIGTLYDEAFHVPLIVVDPSGRFTADIGPPRTGLTSSVDVLPLLVSLGYGGSRSWLTGTLGQIYAERHDLLPMLQSSQAAGRDYVLLATDDTGVPFYNFNKSPMHLVGVRTQDLKFGIYANWQGNTAQIADDSTLETEFYDYSTAKGQAELHNRKHDPRIPALRQSLLGDLIPNVLRAPLPGALGVAQTVSKAAYLAYAALIRNYDPTKSSSAADLAAILPFGQDF